MRMRLAWILGSIAALALGVASGCMDDDDGDSLGTGGAGGAGSPESATGGERDGGAAGLGGGFGLACDPRGTAACENETDCPFVTSGQLQSTAFECGEICGVEVEVEICAVTCVTMELSSTVACSACYAQLVTCANERCFTECFADPSSGVCQRCLGESACASELEECGGVRGE